VSAQTYPSRPVRVIVGFAPGGAPDIVARLLGPTLSQHLGQSFFVENRTGASSKYRDRAVVNAPRDGYTLLLVSPPNFVNATLYVGREGRTHLRCASRTSPRHRCRQWRDESVESGARYQSP
jgi:tripartite-type tricarboxylate transporter receptor subunit TctC